MSLQNVMNFSVPGAVVDTTDVSLRAAGEEGYELFVLWTGVRSGVHLEVEHAYIPDQHSYRGSEGLHVRVDGKELHDLNRWLYEHHQTLAAQVHTHPTDAYHSETDDAFPIVTALGGLSIVVPYFGRDGLRGSGVVGYRLASNGWLEIPRREFESLVRLKS